MHRRRLASLIALSDAKATHSGGCPNESTTWLNSSSVLITVLGTVGPTWVRTDGL